MQDRCLKLNDGRTLGFADYGSRSGVPIFFFHGTPGSRIAGSQIQPLIEGRAIRVIAPERPGYGLSDPQPKRRILDWTNDVEALANHLQLERFHIAGESGGSPYVLACAIGLSKHLISASLISGAMPPDLPQFTKGMALGNRIGFLISRYAPKFLLKKAYTKYAQSVAAHPEKLVKQVEAQLCEWDKQVMKQCRAEGREEELVLDIREAFRQGANGVFRDAVLVARNWKLDLKKITVPVFVWHGTADTLMPITPAQTLAQLIPHCEAHFIPNAGHLLLMSKDIGAQIVTRILSTDA